MELFYSDCLEKDEALNELATESFHRRAISRHYSKFYVLDLIYCLLFLLEPHHHNPYAPIEEFEPLYLGSSPSIPFHMQFTDLSRLPATVQDDTGREFNILVDNILLRQKPIIDETIMSNQFLFKRCIFLIVDAQKNQRK